MTARQDRKTPAQPAAAEDLMDKAIESANDLVDRVQDIVAEQLPPDSGVSDEQGYDRVIETLETSEEIEDIRNAGRAGPERLGHTQAPAGE